MRKTRRTGRTSAATTVSATTLAFGRDLTAEARAGRLDPVVGRSREIRRIAQVLSRRTKNNPVLIGDPGVGKTAIVEGLAQRIVDGTVPVTLTDRCVFGLELPALVAGATLRGEFEKRLRGILEEIRTSDGRILLFIDELHTLVGAGAVEGAMDAGNMLKPMLARGEVHCIGATTVEEYRRHIERDAALERRFQPELVEEPSVGATIEILRGLRALLEAHHVIGIEDAASVAAAQLADRYINDRFLPDKAIDLIDEASAALRTEIDSMPERVEVLQQSLSTMSAENQQIARQELDPLIEQWHAERAAIGSITRLRSDCAPFDQIEAERHRLAQIQGDRPLLHVAVNADDVARVVASWTGVPAARLLQDERAKLLALHERLGQRVVGQPRAVRAVADAVVRARSGVRNPRRPIGSFIFVGPTVVSKTELAKALADALFDTADAILRFDMSEFQEGHSVARIIGAPPGYIGYDEGGQLTERVRRNPYAVVLFDEIEKAHRDVLTALLQVLDDGHLSDSRGRKVDFRNTVLIMTSNARAHTSAEPAGSAQDAFCGHLSREFLGRVDEIIVFDDLGLTDLERIVDLLVDELRDRLAESASLKFELTGAARRQLAQRGLGAPEGARIVRRLISHEVESLVGHLILSDPSLAQSSTVRLAVNERGHFDLLMGPPATSSVPQQASSFAMRRGESVDIAVPVENPLSHPVESPR
jgi:ATP-dependent Clp protease ATP-binding subunit ClpB